jgi:hypothetical protein
MPNTNTLEGIWRGFYQYSRPDPAGNLPVVDFTLILKAGWLGTFQGGVTDDPPHGIPGQGHVYGRVSFPRIKFTKQMPICYVRYPDGRHTTLREAVIAKGHPCKREFPGQKIQYEGEFIAPDRASGTWVISAGFIRLPGRFRVGFKTPGSTGTWSMARQ